MKLSNISLFPRKKVSLSQINHPNVPYFNLIYSTSLTDDTNVEKIYREINKKLSKKGLITVINNDEIKIYKPNMENVTSKELDDIKKIILNTQTKFLDKRTKLANREAMQNFF